MRTFKAYETPRIGVQRILHQDGLPEKPGDMLEVEIIQRLIAMEKQAYQNHRDVLAAIELLQLEVHQQPVHWPRPWYSRLWAWIKRLWN